MALFIVRVNFDRYYNLTQRTNHEKSNTQNRFRPAFYLLKIGADRGYTTFFHHPYYILELRKLTYINPVSIPYHAS